VADRYICRRTAAAEFPITSSRLHELSAGRFWAAAFLWSVEDLFLAVPCTLLLVIVSVASSNPVTRLLSTRFFAFAATISYAFYLFHLPVLQMLSGPSVGQTWSALIRIVSLSLAILVPACFILYQTIENPFLKLKSRLRRVGNAAIPDVGEMRHDRFDPKPAGIPV
jgi:peptidoglycan/LPS O-acetylase OafA/YrhL